MDVFRIGKEGTSAAFSSPNLVILFFLKNSAEDREGENQTPEEGTPSARRLDRTSLTQSV